MTKTMITAVVGVAAMALSAQAASDVSVRWQNVGNRLGDDGKPEYVQRFVVTGNVGRLHRLAFNQFDKKMRAANPSDTVVRIIPGYYYIGSPRFGQTAAGDTLTIDVITSGSLGIKSFGVSDAHGVDAEGKPFDVDFAQMRLTDRSEQWVAPGGRDRMPYADEVYAVNEQLVAGAIPAAYDIVPSFKSVKPTGKGEFKGDAGKITSAIVTHPNSEFYRLTVKPSGILVEGASDAAVATARRIVNRLLDINGGVLPEAVIETWPDYGYRGVMIDVARNYQTLPQMRKFLGLMADYGLNRLQFHFIDDEAWRLEIPGLPELTDYAARRGYTTTEDESLAQIYFGNGDASAPEGSANGYITRSEFVDFLRYADSLGIVVIPEIETPGHARAAVKAMEARYRKTGDATYRMHEDGDTSVYRSAQDFSDNVINPALPGSYRFMEKVFDEIKAMYAEAGAPLEMIHIGGDEVPHGAWSGSPAAQKFMAENGLNGESGLHAYWVNRLAEMLAARGLKLAGWQEVALGKDEDWARGLAPQVGYINLWVTWPGSDGVLPAVKAQELGIPVLVSTGHGYYFDQAYSSHPEENGLWWAAVTDEFNALDAYPAQIAPAVDGGNVIGVQGQLWSETVRGPRMMEQYLFPKMLGMVERAWNSDTTYTRPQFNKVILNHELPYLQRRDVDFHMRQPGIVIAEDGKAVMNSPYPGAEIRYTTDGSEPSRESALYTAPVALPAGCREVRARLYHLGKESVTSLLPLSRVKSEK